MKFLKLTFFLFILISSMPVKAFLTLDDAEIYSMNHPENGIAMDNDDIQNPDFSSYYRRETEFSFRKFFNKWCNSKGLWSANLFKNNLLYLIQRQQNEGYTGKYIIHRTQVPESKYIVFGSLHGAFHSLIRDLLYLKKIGIIDNNFKLLVPHAYIIFNGNVVDGSPFILETLSVILAMMKNNHARVIYIKGEDENNLYWQNGGLKRELQIKLSGMRTVKDNIPLGNLITSFFDTLPLALYLSGLDPADGLIRISNYGMDSDQINENSCAAIFNSLKLKIFEPCFFNVNEKSSAPLVKVIIKNEKNSLDYSYQKGLFTLETDKGATAWRVLSSGNMVYQKYFHFYRDAFIIINTKTSIYDATISLYNRDIRTRSDFKDTETYNLFTTKLLDKSAEKHKQNTQDKSESYVQTKLKNLEEEIENISQSVFDVQRQINKNF